MKTTIKYEFCPLWKRLVYRFIRVFGATFITMMAAAIQTGATLGADLIISTAIGAVAGGLSAADKLIRENGGYVEVTTIGIKWVLRIK